MAIHHHLWRIAALSSAANLLFPAASMAEGLNSGIAVNLIFPWGKLSKPGLGLELYSNYYMCSGNFSSVAAGGSIQWNSGLKQGSRLVTTGTIDAGLTAITPRLEIGAAKGTKGWSMHRGVKVASFLSNVFVRGDGQGYYTGLGPQIGYDIGWGRITPIDSVDCYVIDGRPLRDQQGQQQQGTSHWEDCDAGVQILSEQAEQMATKWAQAAQHEIDSVPAFLQLAWELIANHAPDELIAAALDAAEDEIRHAQQCVAMANRYRHGQLRVTPSHVAGRPILTGKAGLTRLAIESWVDGCLGEGFAAHRAMVAGQQAQYKDARVTQHSIAIDEQKHADLGWKIVSWVLSQDTDGEIRQQLAELRGVAPDMTSTTVTAELQAHGCLSNSQQLAAWEQVHKTSLANLERLLAHRLA